MYYLLKTYFVSVKYKRGLLRMGVELGDKHIEAMVSSNAACARVMDPGDTDILPGTLLDIVDF